MVIHVRLGIWVVGIIPLVANHGLAPRNMLEAKSTQSEGLISESSRSPEQTCQSWSRDALECFGVWSLCMGD